MRTEDQDDTLSYYVGQEQLDAVDRMLEEMDLDERFDRVPAAFRIVERFEQQQLQEQQQHSHIHGHLRDAIEQDENPVNGHGRLQHDEVEVDQEGEGAEPIGYIPLGQGEESDNDDSDDSVDENAGYIEIQSDAEEDFENEDEDNDSQGYDGYLRTPTRHGAAPIPVIPQAVQIDLEASDFTAEKIPEEDLKTIAMVMSSISLPAPDWAKSIPEERWLPKIVQQAEATVASSSSSSSEP
ncbi:hypothetical protein BGZ65_011353 [Modicella reniformis]|uniref:Male-enhanced antigen 1 n=1 Tax=Modicella reniformis TaxID=1440133 RepID=A0A9P6IPD2_9FUNG|nr:hypothetical protein BGZ65_011353 [Modicella reniformis]